MVSKKEKVKIITKVLEKKYGNPKTPLKHKNSFQLLVSVILSAQCTDERVNKVTPALFKKYKNAKDFAECDIHDLEKLIFSTGFYKNKAKNIKACAQKLVSDFNSKIPRTMDEMITLPGVGRKTANVILGDFYGKREGIVVDTHVGRLAVRLGLTDTENSKAAVKIERDLIKIVPSEDWMRFSLYLVFHGRERCYARKPDCRNCELQKVCPSYGKC